MTKEEKLRKRATYKTFQRCDKDFVLALYLDGVAKKESALPTVPLEVRKVHLHEIYRALNAHGAYGSLLSAMYAEESLQQYLKDMQEL